MNKHNLLYISAIFVLVTMLFLLLNKDKQVEVVEEHVTDTLVVTKIDTIVEYRLVEKTKRVVDTIYIENKTPNEPFVAVLSEQKHYSKPNLYDIYLSGYKAKLDSIKIYPTIEYRTVTKEIEITKWNYYGYIGLNNIGGSFNPNFGFLAQSKKKWIFGCELGLYNNNKFYYGVKIGCKLNK